MSGCARRRWGEGTTCERPADTPAAKEMAARLSAMQAERQRQDAAWSAPTVPAATQQQAAPTVSLSLGDQKPSSSGRKNAS
jgi:hypothetical protein